MRPETLIINQCTDQIKKLNVWSKHEVPVWSFLVLEKQPAGVNVAKIFLELDRSFIRQHAGFPELIKNHL